MKRIILMAGVLAMAAAASLPLPATAQSDRAAQSMIDRLLPSTGSGTRGIRVPGEAAAPSTPVAPAPIWSAVPGASPNASPAPERPRALPQQAVAPRPLPASRETTTDAPSVSITVTFSTGSATLTAEAERALMPLGRALASPELAPYRFRIEGHTDTVGDATVNQSLSERRAAAVRDHLARTYGVEATRLVAVGFGSSQLLVSTRPQVADPRNRRVQVVNLGN